MASLTSIFRPSDSEAGRRSWRPSPEPEPVVTPETFAQCKELMRPVQKKIIEFGSDTDSDKSTEVQVSLLVKFTLLTVLLTRVSVVVLRFQEMFDGYRRPHRKSSGQRGQRRRRDLEIQTVVFCFQFQSTLQQGPLPDVSSSEGRSQRQQIVPMILLKVIILFQLLIL